MDEVLPIHQVCMYNQPVVLYYSYNCHQQVEHLKTTSRILNSLLSLANYFVLNQDQVLNK